MKTSSILELILTLTIGIGDLRQSKFPAYDVNWHALAPEQ